MTKRTYQIHRPLHKHYTYNASIRDATRPQDWNSSWEDMQNELRNGPVKIIKPKEN